MRAVTWNVNGLRACEKKGFADFFDRIDADFFCIQETKMQEDQLTQLAFTAEGRHAFWNSAEKRGYSGTAVFAKEAPDAVTKEMETGGVSNEGRVLTLEYPGFFLVNAYVPNVRRDLERIPLRMEWEDALRAHLLALDAKKPFAAVTPPVIFFMLPPFLPKPFFGRSSRPGGSAPGPEMLCSLPGRIRISLRSL